jgi:hypothetical protein
LIAFEKIDRSGSFALIKEQFAIEPPLLGCFPHIMPPECYVLTDLTSDVVTFPSSRHFDRVWEIELHDSVFQNHDCLSMLRGLTIELTNDEVSNRLTVAPAAKITPGVRENEMFQIPTNAEYFFFIYPFMDVATTADMKRTVCFSIILRDTICVYDLRNS